MTPLLDVVFATFRAAPALDSDEARLGIASTQLGLRWRAVAWDDADFDWSSARCVVVRSTWDYTRRRDEFLAWTRRVEAVTQLHNPADVLERNTEKSYLLALAARGVPVIPTVLAGPRATRDLDGLLAELGWDEAIVKPAISAGSWRTYRVRRGVADHAATSTRRLLLTRRCLVQPFLPGVIDPGERALVVIDGELTHAIRKRSVFEHADVPFRVAVEAEPDEIALCDRVLDASGARSLLYARVDVVRGADGAPLLMELELTEPRLFLAVGPESASLRFAEAIARRLSGPPAS